MTQEERRIYLIGALRAENSQYRHTDIPRGGAEQERLLRALMNVRPPRPASRAFLEVQDAYLSQELDRRGIVDCAALPPSRLDSRIALWRGDITRMRADAIVNAANGALLGCFRPCHACIDNVIHTWAGVQLRLACSALMEAQGHEEPPGRAKLTPGYNLPSRHVLHTVGPVVTGAVGERERALLASCYRSCLELAAASGLRSVAFCCISTGVYRFPQAEAARIAVEAVSRYLARDTALDRVIFDVFTERDLALYRALLGGGAAETA